MSIRKRTCLSMAVAIGCLSGTAVNVGAREQFGDILLTPASSAAQACSHGYLDYRLEVSNLSPSRSRTVTLSFPARAYGSGESISTVRRSIAIGPASRAVVSLLQPPLPLFGDANVSVAVDGRRLGVMKLSAAESNSHTKKTQICLLISRSINSEHLNAALEKIAPTTTHVGHHRSASERAFDIVKAESEIPEWSENWLSYTGFDGIVIRDSDIRAMPAPVTEALVRYVTSGGLLVTLGQNQLFDLPRASITSAPEGMTAAVYGFGQYMNIREANLSSISSSCLSAFWKVCRDTANPWHTGMNKTDIRQQFPVVESIGVSIRAMFLIIVGFAVLIGPVNLIVLARWNRRIWMLWTVPAFSFVACGILFSWFMLAEGTTPTVRMETLTWLDEETRMAASLGVSGYYCPLTPAGGLHFDYSTEITPQVDRNGYGTTVSRTLDWSRDQHLASGWVQARIPTHFMMRKCEFRRERLPFTRTPDGTRAVVNGLGRPVLQLWTADADGRVYEARHIPAGAQAELFPSAGATTATGSVERLRAIYSGGDWHKTIATLTNNPAASLLPGTYIALLDGCPFVENGLTGASHDNFKSTVYGFLPKTEERDGGNDPN